MNTEYLISFSGGIGSAASLLLAHKHNLSYAAIFADTLIEDEDLYRFKWDIESYIGKEITTLTDGRTPWEVYIDERFIGNSRTAHCSQRLKTDIVRDYIKTNWGINDYPILVLGMSKEESERIDRAKIRWNPIPVDSLLVKYGLNSRCEMESLINDCGIKIPRLYDYGFPHNNCGGFCCRSGQTQFATLLKHFPERFAWHEEQEQIARQKIGPTARPFLRMTRNGKLQYITLREFRLLVESGELTPPLYDFGGCACFVDEVENETNH